MKILVVVDMQKDFVDGSLGSKEAVSIIPNVVEKIKAYKDELVFATYDTHKENYLDTFEGKNLPVKHCIHKTVGWELNKDVENALLECREVDKVLKTTFGYSNWESRIRMLTRLSEVTQIELCGLCTDICVISNALILRALFPNTPIVVDSSCCAGVTVDKHNAALEVMRSCQIDVI